MGAGGESRINRTSTYPQNMQTILSLEGKKSVFGRTSLIDDLLPLFSTTVYSPQFNCRHYFHPKACMVIEYYVTNSSRLLQVSLFTWFNSNDVYN